MLLGVAALAVAIPPPTAAHSFAPALLELIESEPERATVRWKQPTVRVAGSRFHRREPYTVKLEGVTAIGFRTVFVAGVRDPVLVAGLDGFVAQCRRRVANEVAGLGLGAATATRSRSRLRSMAGAAFLRASPVMPCLTGPAKRKCSFRLSRGGTDCRVV